MPPASQPPDIEPDEAVEPVEAVDVQAASALEAEPDAGPAGSPTLPVEPEPEPEPIPEPEPAPVIEPDPPAAEETTLEDARLGVSPFSRATALANAEARASQQSLVRGGASAPLGADQLNALRVEFLDQWDSRWQRDPGRSNGPYS